MTIDIWDYSDNEVKVFTDSRDALELLFKISKCSETTTYSYDIHVVGWDVIILKDKVHKFKLQLRRLREPIIFQTVNELVNTQFQNSKGKPQRINQKKKAV